MRVTGNEQVASAMALYSRAYGDAPGAETSWGVIWVSRMRICEEVLVVVGSWSGATYKVVVVFYVASNSHLSSAVTAWDVPFAPVVGVYTPWREVVAVRGSLVLLADEGVAGPERFWVHVGVCAGSDVGQAQGRMRCIRCRGWRVVLL